MTLQMYSFIVRQLLRQIPIAEGDIGLQKHLLRAAPFNSRKIAGPTFRRTLPASLLRRNLRIVSLRPEGQSSSYNFKAEDFLNCAHAQHKITSPHAKILKQKFHSPKWWAFNVPCLTKHFGSPCGYTCLQPVWQGGGTTALLGLPHDFNQSLGRFRMSRYDPCYCLSETTQQLATISLTSRAPTVT